MSEIMYDTVKKIWMRDCTKCDRLFTVVADGYSKAEELFKEFFYTYGGGTVLTSKCKSCMSAQSNKRNADIHKLDLLEAQDGKCAICEKPLALKTGTRVCVDHCHKTGAIRGLVCFRCNLRMEGVDDEEWLTKAIAYRDSFKEESS